MTSFNYIPTLKESDWDALQSELNKKPDEDIREAVRKWANAE